MASQLEQKEQQSDQSHQDHDEGHGQPEEQREATESGRKESLGCFRAVDQRNGDEHEQEHVAPRQAPRAARRPD